MKNVQSPIGRSASAIAKIISIGISGSVLICLLILLIFSNSLVNSYVKPIIVKTFTATYPAYALHIADIKFSPLQNRFEFDSVSIGSSNGKISGTISSFSVKGIEWVHLLWGGDLTTEDFSRAVVEMNDVAMKFPVMGYELSCEQMYVSVPDSEMRAEITEIHPLGDDEEFFRENPFQRTRFNCFVQRSTVMGLASLELLKGKLYRTRFVQFQDVVLDILVNNDKPINKNTLSPLMPNELLSSIKGVLQIDSLSVTNGEVIYGERFSVGSKPAVITFDHVQMLAKGITNRGVVGDRITIGAEGKFQKTGAMSVTMSIPVASPEFSFQYSGVLEKMELSELNSFLEISEQMRVKSGFLQMATFDVSVVSGQATGNVRAFYRNLYFVAINKYTGSENGFFNKIASFIAKTFTIHSSNIPDKNGSMKIGKVKYSRKRDDPFFRFSWFSIRSGVKDVVGF